MIDLPRDTSRSVARDLLAAGAVIVRPDEAFVWASGMRAPIYCDNRVTLSLPDTRSRITDALERAIRAHFPAADTVAGVATAGIPQATLVADRLELPLVYVRGSAKGHGRENRVEGRLERGARVVVIEDLVSTGGSSLAAVDVLRASGARVLAVAAVFSYDLAVAAEAFSGKAVELHVLATLEDLLTEASAQGGLTEEEADVVRRWREDPEGWGGWRL